MATLYAWPLLSRLTTAIPAQPQFADVTEYVWSVGWIARALSEREPLFYTHTLFVPFGADLRLGTFGLLQGLTAYPFTGWLGVVGAFNLVLFSTLLLNGIAGYALTHRAVRSAPASFAAAALFMLSAPILQHICVGRAALGGMWLVVGVLFALEQTLSLPSLRNACLLAAFLIGALVSDFQLLLFAVLWSIAFGCGRLLQGGSTLLGREQAAALGAAAALSVLVFSWLYAPVFSESALQGYPRPDLKSMAVYSFRWWDFLTPSVAPYIYGYGFGILTLIALATFRGRGEYRLWLAGALCFLLLSLGPRLQPTAIPMPFAVLGAVPALAQFRTPYRLVMPAQIGLMLVSGLALAHWLPRLRLARWAWWFAGAIATVNLLVVSTLLPFRVQTYRDYRFYRTVAAEPGDFALLEVPFGVRSGLERIGNGGEVVQYYQHIHGKRLLNGSLARLPSRLFKFYRGHPALVFLSGEPGPAGPELQRDLDAVLRWSGARYLLVHRSLLSAEESQRFELFLDQQPGLKRITVEDDLVVYRVAAPLP